MAPLSRLKDLPVTNQCVVVCDLRLLGDGDSPCWEALKGSQDDVGRRLASLVVDAGLGRIDDFGGVCKTFLCDGEAYLPDPPTTIGRAGVFSFTPKKKIVAEGEAMARASKAAGYSLLILTVQKHDTFGKVWVLCGVLRHLDDRRLTYFEDTHTVVDEIKESAEGAKIIAVHVLAPGFEGFNARLADRIVTQEEYQREVLG